MLMSVETTENQPQQSKQKSNVGVVCRLGENASVARKSPGFYR